MPMTRPRRSSIQKSSGRGADFRLCERQQRDRRHSAGKRVRNGRNRRDVGGTGQQEPARPVVAVDTFLDRQHQLWCALDLVAR